ncbi:centrosomal protein POC5 isoform X2 [Numida meleagris]|uniref:centrosomal protein POC5 isoform X2 n=1 Tax=Numida meleagris TaxID=8996 RepID=UPI000B3DE49D|nr:centrosomal protein POC5 isoform X2 [Numida meleagris]
MSSDEEKSTSPILPKDSVRGSSVSSDLQDEYEELLRYAVVTPRFELCVPKQSEPSSELRGGGRFSSLTHDAIYHETPDLLSVKEHTEVSMEQLCPVSEETSSQESTHVPREIDETIATELTVPDEKVTQIENILDLWSGSLKTNVLSELRKWKLSFIEHHKHQMRQEKEKHAEHVKQLNNEMENLKELLRTYEISVGRKDEVITNMTEALDRKKEKIELMRRFTVWRIQQIKAKQEEYANRIADKQFQTALKKKVWTAWRSLSEERWKEKVAKACQLRAEDICVQLTNDYEAKIAELTATLEQTKAEILRLHSEREQYEDTMKKAFMRGVCALNLEAMTMFQGKDNRTDPDAGSRREDNGAIIAGRLPPSQYNPPSPPPAPATTLQMEDLPMAKVITAAQQKAGRTITARITGRSDMGQKQRICGSVAVMGVAPPMSSVIVEKHHPVTQQTISQATAAKYPRTVFLASSSATVRPAGQVGRMLQSQTHTSVQSIKVVD